MPASDRPKRNVKPPQHSLQSAAATTSTTTSRKTSWAPSKILSSSSAITAPSIDIHAFLVTCISGFSDYTEEEKVGIIESLPEPYRKYNRDKDNKLECPISIDFVMRDPFLKRAISKFKNDVGEGFYDPGWQAKAKKAMQERREGKFDEYMEQHVEEMFGDGNTSQASKDGVSALENGVTDGMVTANNKAITGHDEAEDSDEAISSDGEWVEKKSRKITQR